MFALFPAGGFAPVSRNAVIGWGIAYAAFLAYAFLNTSGFLFIDHANLMFHEVGHAVFGWAGYIATYMADARRSALPLVGSDESDWTIPFSHWGLLQHDLTIAAWTRGLGWIGMIATIAWLIWMHARDEE